MLAQNFKTAADLKVTEAQKAALSKTLVMLETGKLKFFDRDSPISYLDTAFEDRRFSGQFNMASWSLPHTCGTVCCIGGTAEMVGGLPVYSLDTASEQNEKLDALFYPKNISHYQNITPDQAATALRSYLTTGDARWDLAVA